MAKPSNAGYLFERLCWLSFAVPMFWTAFVKPGYFGHLTYWTLMVHLVYFCVDKSSPHATASIYLLHGMSFCGAMAVFIGYSFISLGGMYRYGTWIAWENAVGAAAGRIQRGAAHIHCCGAPASRFPRDPAASACRHPRCCRRCPRARWLPCTKRRV